VDCELAYHEFIQDDLTPLVHELARRDGGALVLYCISPEWRRELAGMFLRG
jgi:hypothetical protein